MESHQPKVGKYGKQHASSSFIDHEYQTAMGRYIYRETFNPEQILPPVVLGIMDVKDSKGNQT